MEILNKYIKATSTYGCEEVRKFLHPKAMYFFSNQTCINHQEIQSYFENALTYFRDVNYEAREVKWLLK